MADSITRRDMLKATAGSLALGAMPRAARAAAGGKRKPNLLFLWTDEQRTDTMAAYGNRKIHVPNLDRLASQSVVFRSPHDTQPVCTPARSSVMTGLWPHQSGCVTNNIPLPKEVPCLPEIVGDADYRTAYMGKWHLGDELFAQHGFEEWVSIEDIYNAHFSPGRDRNARSSYHHFLLEQGYKPNRNGSFSREFAAKLPLEHSKPVFLEGKACDFLRRHRREPFILYVNFLEPHMPFTGPLDDEYNPAEIELPANFDDPLEENEPLRYRAGRENWMREYPTVEDWRALIARYWGLVTEVDRSVGGILRALDELGLAEDTIVVFTSDHGDMMGSHRMLTKSVMYEEACRIPWLMRVPRLNAAGRIIEQPVSHIDMVPTLLELMGAEPKRPLPGQSLVPLVQGKKVAEDHVFVEWNPAPGKVTHEEIPGKQSGDELKRVAKTSTRTVISPDGWKLCLSDRDKCQLFHLAEDPGETKNLFDSGRHQEVIQRLTERIHGWQERVGDRVRV
jgi:arylsulfatase A-like enzyme